VLLALAWVDLRRQAVRAGRHAHRRVLVHVLQQQRLADGGLVVDAGAAVAMTARSAQKEALPETARCGPSDKSAN